jgi:hypothetical protein
MPMQKYLTQAKYFLVICFLLLASHGCSPVKCDNIQSPKTCFRILFIGNSYTYVNDLPNTFAKLADSGNHQVEIGMFAKGGWTLSDQIKSSEMLNTLQSSKWDYVIVQEQSQIPSMEQSRSYAMYPAARTLIGKIRETGANPIFFETWAHQNGWPENGMPNFESMQYQIDLGYQLIAQELNVSIAPVGDVWFNAITQDPQLELWQDDGSHPTELGTYLTACVFYAVIFQENPQGLSYLGNLSEETAHTLQTSAAKSVLKIP